MRRKRSKWRNLVSLRPPRSRRARCDTTLSVSWKSNKEYLLLNNPNQYDFIIAGAGCAGLSLLVRLLKSGHFHDKRFLLIDKDREKTNDRTWCFWEQEPGFFDGLVYRRWSRLDFFGEMYEAELDISPYQYKMIRGEDFYRYCFGEIEKYPQVDRLYSEIKEIKEEQGRSFIYLADRVLDTAGAIVFNSVYQPAIPQQKDITLLQHFKGWVIETEQKIFNPAKATLMDFRVHQQYGTSFIYVLPFDVHTALVEYTLFTPSLLKPEQYEEELKNYIGTFLKAGSYKVKEKEYGVIPMTNLSFPFYKNAVFHIGMAGGQTKASTGYTFRFIQKQVEQIMQCLINDEPLTSIPSTPSRFRFYDNTLLHILYHDRLPGRKIFSDLFRKNEVTRVLRFLDNESNGMDELKIISSLPTWPFLKAAIASLGH